MTIDALALAQVQKLVNDGQDIYVIHSYKYGVVFYSDHSNIEHFADKWNWREIKLTASEMKYLGCGAATYLQRHRSGLKFVEGDVFCLIKI